MNRLLQAIIQKLTVNLQNCALADNNSASLRFYKLKFSYQPNNLSDMEICRNKTTRSNIKTELPEGTHLIFNCARGSFERCYIFYCHPNIIQLSSFVHKKSQLLGWHLQDYVVYRARKHPQFLRGAILTIIIDHGSEIRSNLKQL